MGTSKQLSVGPDALASILVRGIPIASPAFIPADRRELKRRTHRLQRHLYHHHLQSLPLGHCPCVGAPGPPPIVVGSALTMISTKGGLFLLALGFFRLGFLDNML